MLQFITNDSNGYSHFEGARLALKGGCKWIQLRMKKSPKSEIIEVAKELKKECKKFDAILIIDDHVDIATEVKADGVHLGKGDMNPIEARQIMGEKYIIGGTANTYNDIENLVKANVDYIGLGPYRFTKTKENLSPILGIEGYREITAKCNDRGFKTPIVAIGGLNCDDIAGLIECGVSGVAMSSNILQAENPVRETEKILETLYKNRYER